MKLATPQKGTSWPSLIADIELVGEANGKPFPFEKEAQIRSVLSSTVKPRFPDRVYRTAKKIEKGITVLWIWRAA